MVKRLTHTVRRQNSTTLHHIAANPIINHHHRRHSLDIHHIIILIIQHPAHPDRHSLAHLKRPNPIHPVHPQPQEPLQPVLRRRLRAVPLPYFGPQRAPRRQIVPEARLRRLQPRRLHIQVSTRAVRLLIEQQQPQSAIRQSKQRRVRRQPDPQRVRASLERALGLVVQEKSATPRQLLSEDQNQGDRPVDQPGHAELCVELLAGQ